MDYRIRRGDQEFGPYSLADLQRYIQTGHVAATDVAQSEGMTDWIPVSQILGNIPAPAMALAGAAGVISFEATYPQERVALPPNLHWALLLVINIVTRGVFNIIWAFVQANWARKLSGKNAPMVLIAMYPAGLIPGFFAFFLGSGSHIPGLVFIGSLLILGGIVCMIVGVFKIKHAMEEYYNSVENIGLSLSAGMTFFFRAIYIQYHVNRIARMKKTGEIV